MSLGHEQLNQFYGAYYEPCDPATGAHPLPKIIESLSQLPAVREHGINVVDALHRSLSPEFLRPEAVAIVEKVLEKQGFVYIWSVGDEGEHHDPATGATQPATNFQRQKIAASGLQGKLIQRFGESYVSNHFQMRISPSNKHAALGDILNEVRPFASSVYLVDDQPKNVEFARKTFAGSTPPVHDFLLDNNHPDGDLAAFHAYLNTHLGEEGQAGKVPVLIADWDDTFWSEQARLHTLAHALLETPPTATHQ